MVPLMNHHITDQLLLFQAVVAKVLEKIITTQLSYYLEEHQLFNSHQGAYHHGIRVLRTFCWLQWMLLFITWIRILMNLSVLPF